MQRSHPGRNLAGQYLTGLYLAWRGLQEQHPARRTRIGVLRNWPLALPWAPGRRRGRTQTCRRDRVRPARGREPGPSLISPAHQDAKLEDLKGLPGGRLGTARQFRPYPSEPSGGSTVTSCSRPTCAISLPGHASAGRTSQFASVRKHAGSQRPSPGWLTAGQAPNPRSGSEPPVRLRTVGCARRRTATRGGSRAGGRRASRRRRSKTPSARSARAGSPRGAAPQRS
jgi:hypothetical protein